MEKHADPKIKTYSGVTTLLLLCSGCTHHNLIDIARLLIENGVDINAKTPGEDEWTALDLLCLRYAHDNLIGLVELLISKGAVLKNTLHILFLNGAQLHKTNNFFDIVRLMIYKGVVVNLQIPSGGMTALH